MHANSAVPVIVEPGGDQVVGHVGLHALGCFADRLGLGEALSGRIPLRGERLPLHDRGKVLVHSALMLAGGGESCADIEHLRAQEDLFGSVPSDSTMHRTFHEITDPVREDLLEALAEVRAEVWRRSSATSGTDTLMLDIDASLIEVHSENKAGTGPTYKGGFGFHPMFCFCDATGEALSGKLRPGNAGSTTLADHVEVLDAAIAQLPAEVAAGHRVGEDPGAVGRRVVVRTDSAGCSTKFAFACRARNVGFFFVARTNTQLQGAIFDTLGIEDLWTPALHQDGTLRPGAGVAELTELVDLSAWPEGTRLIVRREPLHPGAQHSLFPSLEFRYWGHYTDQDGEPTELDCTMRAHAHVELHIGRLKDSGLLSFPFSDLCANRTWMQIVMMAGDLVRWFQLLCLEGRWAKALPKALRWGFFHAPGRLVRRARQRVVRILDGWPTADVLVAAYARIAALS